MLHDVFGDCADLVKGQILPRDLIVQQASLFFVQPKLFDEAVYLLDVRLSHHAYDFIGDRKLLLHGLEASLGLA